jgi:hypothetical protein
MMPTMHTLILVLALALALPSQADVSPFLGTWNMTGTGGDSAVVYWLQVTQEGGALKGRFLNRSGSPYDLPAIRVENGELVFANAPREGQPPPPEWRARLVDGRLAGTTTIARRDPAQPPQVVNWIGVRPPAWPAVNANGRHTYGTPVPLFDGATMDAWGVQHQQRPINWSVADGVMHSAEKAGNNLVSTQTFGDFKIEAEYAIAPGSNGGIYLRGRYELQLLDDAGQPVTSQSHMAIYGRTPPAANASRTADEWQRMEAVVVGNRVSVTLNGRQVHDNAVIEGITGGALDANEAAPGPIMLQGDHGKVMFRRVVVTPITRAGS